MLGRVHGRGVAVNDRTVPVSEFFGPVFQGEGPATGRRAWFLRLGQCNLGCSWCDSAYTWDGTEKFTPYTRDGLWCLLAPVDGILVLTGGEPLLHQQNPALWDALSVNEVHVETNGTIAPNDKARAHVDHFVVSPKLFNQGDPVKRRIKEGPLWEFSELAHTGRASFKVVCGTVDEVHEAAEFFDRFKVAGDARWIMPLGTERDEVLATALHLEDTITALGLNLTLRQHVLMHGKDRNR